MAQKTKAAARQPRTLKPSAKPAPIKAKPAKAAAAPKAALSKTLKAAKAAPAEKVAKPTVMKTAPEKSAAVKTAPVKPAPAAKTSAEKSASAKPEKQIEQAKAALKKETAQAAAPVKESKARSRKLSIEISANESASALAQKWGTLYKKAEQIEAKPYNMKAVFEEKTAITHKVLGWGYILANRNDRLEVLFKDGIKYLISNYKP